MRTRRSLSSSAANWAAQCSSSAISARMNLASILIRRRCQESRNIPCASTATSTTSARPFFALCKAKLQLCPLSERRSTWVLAPNFQTAQTRRQLLIRPAARDYFCLCIEVHAIFTQRVQVAKEGALPAGEGEERNRRGHAYVDAHHPCRHVLGKLPGSAAGAGKDRSRVAIL